MEGGGALVALQAMKAHPREAGVQVGLGAGGRGSTERQDPGPPCPCPHPHPSPILSKSSSFPGPKGIYFHSLKMHPILPMAVFLYLCSSCIDLFLF